MEEFRVLGSPECVLLVLFDAAVLHAIALDDFQLECRGRVPVLLRPGGESTL